jgi:hypothetical protein
MSLIIWLTVRHLKFCPPEYHRWQSLSLVRPQMQQSATSSQHTNIICPSTVAGNFLSARLNQTTCLLAVTCVHKPKGNTASTLFKYGTWQLRITWKMWTPESRQSGIAANATPTAVKRNGPTESWRQSSDEITSMFIMSASALVSYVQTRNCIVIYLYCDISVLWYLCIVISLYCDISVLWYICIVIFLYCDISVLWYICIVIYLYCDISVLWYIFIVIYMYCDISVLWYLCIVIYMYCGISILWYLCIVIYLYCDISVLWYICIVIFLYCNISVLWYICIVISLYCDISELWYICIVISLHHYEFEINCIFPTSCCYLFHCSRSSFGTPCCSGYRLRLQSGIRASDSGHE